MKFTTEEKIVYIEQEGVVRMGRRAAREKALQALFQVDVGKTDAEMAYEHVLSNQLDENDRKFLHTLFFGTVEHLNEIDELISKHLENWTIDRLANVDRNLLRIAVYEMNYIDDVPYIVSINEAIEIAKRFGDEKSSKFINGVLSNVKAELEQ